MGTIVAKIGPVNDIVNMKRYFFLVSIAFCCLVLQVSCSKVDIVSPVASVNVRSASFDNNGGSYDLVLTCNTDWTSSCDFDEVKVDPSSGYGSSIVKLTVPANLGKLTENIRIVFTATGANSDTTTTTSSVRTVATVSAAPFIDLDRNEVTLPAEGGGIRMELYSNSSWKIADGSDLGVVEITPVEGTFNAHLAVSAPANTTGGQKRYAVNFVLDNHPSIYQKLTIVQKSL